MDGLKLTLTTKDGEVLTEYELDQYTTMHSYPGGAPTRYPMIHNLLMGELNDFISNWRKKNAKG